MSEPKPPPRLMAVALEPLSLVDWTRLVDFLKSGGGVIELPKGVELYQLVDGRWELLEANLGSN